jgi:hypothetical protein
VVLFFQEEVKIIDQLIFCLIASSVINFIPLISILFFFTHFKLFQTIFYMAEILTILNCGSLVNKHERFELEDLTPIMGGDEEEEQPLSPGANNTT